MALSFYFSFLVKESLIKIGVYFLANNKFLFFNAPIKLYIYGLKNIR